MNSGSADKPFRISRGLTLVEALIVIAIALTISASAVAAFIQVLKISQKTEIRRQAVESLRSALEDMSREIKMATATTPPLFITDTLTLAHGDRIDNNSNGIADEEDPDGTDTNLDWTLADVLGYDGTADGTFSERGVGVASLGDRKIDVDVKFSDDALTFYTSDNRIVSYEITSFEGEDFVLVKRVTTDPAAIDLAPAAPLAFNVVSLNFLYWDSNADDDARTWLEAWDPADYDPATEFVLPAAVRVEAMAYIGENQLSTGLLESGTQLPVERLHTLINIEETIQDADY